MNELMFQGGMKSEVIGFSSRFAKTKISHVLIQGQSLNLANLCKSKAYPSSSRLFA